jgi:hypothetical protein
MSVSSEFGFKRLTATNWLAVDPIWQGFWMSSSLPDPSSAWVDDLTRFELDPAVPPAIRKLFEVGRGTLAYSLMFYPLLTLGTEQIFRVLETSAAVKCAGKMPPAGKLSTAPKRGGRFECHRRLELDCRVILSAPRARQGRVRGHTSSALHPELRRATSATADNAARFGAMMQSQSLVIATILLPANHAYI